MAKKVFIGVGHGGTDPGAVANGIKEKDVNLTLALACREELVRHGVTVQMSRTRDEQDPLTEEIKEANAFGPDLAVDIHNNAGGGDGAEVFHSVIGSGKELARNILDEIVAMGQNSRGIKTRKNAAGKDYFGFIRQINAPAVIVECAFLDNAADVKVIDTAAEQKAMGVAIAKGILKTLGIAYQEPVTAAKYYRVRKSWDDAKSQLGAFTKLENAKTACAAGYTVYDWNGNAVYTKPLTKTNQEIAREVLDGKWGNGAARKRRLTAAGYDYRAIQDLVNEMAG